MAMISWQQLFFVMAIFLIAYYGAVALIFYRRELGRLLNRRAFVPSREENTSLPAKPPQAASDPQIYQVVMDLMDETKSVLKAAVDESLDKEQVIAALRYRLLSYSQIKGTAFQIAINNHIDQEIKERLGWSLTETDIRDIW